MFPKQRRPRRATPREEEDCAQDRSSREQAKQGARRTKSAGHTPPKINPVEPRRMKRRGRDLLPQAERDGSHQLRITNYELRCTLPLNNKLLSALISSRRHTEQIGAAWECAGVQCGGVVSRHLRLGDECCDD